MDRYFTSVGLCEELSFDYKLTVVSTVKSNFRGLLEPLKIAKKRKAENTIFAWNGKSMLISHVPKRH